MLDNVQINIFLQENPFYGSILLTSMPYNSHAVRDNEDSFMFVVVIYLGNHAKDCPVQEPFIGYLYAFH